MSRPVERPAGRATEEWAQSPDPKRHGPPDHDWWPGPCTAELPAAIRPDLRKLVGELRRQLVEWRLLADRTMDPRLREALYGNVLAWEDLLCRHMPSATGRCRCCRSAWGRPATWPCVVFATISLALGRRNWHPEQQRRGVSRQ